jgi:hypothetical protein
MSNDKDSTPKTARELIAAIQKRAQARAKARVQGAPEVGIFWVVEGKPIVFGDPLSEAEPWGEFKNYRQSHYSLWRFLQRNGAVPQDSEYEDYPRGRVVYNTPTSSFAFFADRCILKNKPMVEHLLSELHLPSSTKTESDPHYRCKKCGG